MSFVDFLRMFFGWEDNREAAGFLSWKHLLFVTVYIAIATVLAVFLAKKHKNGTEKEKLRVLKIASVVMLSCEALKIVIISVRSQDALAFLGMLPLFLCSIHLFSIALGAFTKGVVQEAALTFLYVFGILSSLAGTYLAGNYFGSSAVFSFDLMVSVTTHTISGFSSLYLILVGLIKIDKKKVIECAAILFVFTILAHLANVLLEPTSYESNYMFLSRSSGTPFAIVDTMVGGNKVLYGVMVALLQYAYMFAFLGVYFLIKKLQAKKKVA